MIDRLPKLRRLHRRLAGEPAWPPPLDRPCRRLRAALGLGASLLLTGAAAAAGASVPLPPAPTRPGAEAGATRISVDAWFADISAIDSSAQTFSASLVLVLRWHDPGLAHRDAETRTYAVGDIWHPRWMIANEGADVRRSLPETLDVEPDGTVVYRQRVLGSFSEQLNLHRFPFDADDFRVHVVLPGHRPEEVEFVPDAAAVAAGLPFAAGAAEDLSLQDWRVTSVTARPEPYVIGRGVEIAGYAVEFHAERRARHYVLTVLVPLVLIVLMSWTVLWIDPSQTAPQVSIAITSMLTLIAYRFAVGADVPKLPYLTVLDRFILASSILVFLSLVEVVVTTTLALRGRIDTARTLDRQARWVFPSVFVLLAGVIFWGRAAGAMWRGGE